jgi:hypothetical protein
VHSARGAGRRRARGCSRACADENAREPAQLAQAGAASAPPLAATALDACRAGPRSAAHGRPRHARRRRLRKRLRQARDRDMRGDWEGRRTRTVGGATVTVAEWWREPLLVRRRTALSPGDMRPPARPSAGARGGHLATTALQLAAGTPRLLGCSLGNRRGRPSHRALRPRHIPGKALCRRRIPREPGQTIHRL